MSVVFIIVSYGNSVSDVAPLLQHPTETMH